MSRELYGALIGICTLLILFLPIPLFIITVAFLSLMMAKELCSHLELDELYPSAFFGPVLFFIHPSLGGIYSSLIALSYGYVLWNLEAFFRSLFVLFYTGFFPSFIISIKEESVYYLVVFFLMIWANDVFAYYVGRSIGRTPLFPKLSPKKTLEGFFGGLFAGVILFVLLSKEPVLKSVFVGVITLSAGVAGDYFKSFIKRQLGIKDFSNVFGGHGGFVDRFDAVVFSAPLFYWLMFRI